MPNRLITGERVIDGALAFVTANVSLAADLLELKAALIAIGVLALKEAGKVLFKYLEKKYLNADKPGGIKAGPNPDNKPPGHPGTDSKND